MSDWIVRVGQEEYRARDRETVKQWWRAGRVTAACHIFDPELQQWISLDAFSEQHAGSVLVTTTPLLDGYRIVRYITVDMVIGPTWNLVVTTADDVEKIRAAVLLTVRSRATMYSGNAVVGLKMDFVSAGFIGPVLIACGTIVEVEPAPPPASP